MNSTLLLECLRRELDLWTAKPYDTLVRELEHVCVYYVGQDSEHCRFEVDRIECTPEYIHVIISIDDGGLRALVPLTTTFIAYRDGHVEKPSDGNEIRPHLTLPYVLIKRAVAVWLVLVTVEFAHGILRAIFLVPVAGDLRSRQIGVPTGSLLVLLVAYLYVPWLRVRTTRALVTIGGLWVVLTVAFELCFGHFLFGRSWAELASDYDPFHGGFLGIGMIILLLSPVIAARLRRRVH